MRIKTLLAGLSGSLLLSLAPMSVMAAGTTVVTPANTQGWSTADTRTGGAVTFIADATSPLPTGALQLTTDATTTSKAQYLHAANTTIAGVTELSYSTKQVSGPVIAAASYQLIVDLNGAETGGFTTFVYEPYQNGTVTAGTWQTWDVDAGMFWSSRSFSSASCVTLAGAGGAPFYALADIKANCPNAVAIGFGVNIGTNNPSYDVEVDKFVFNDDTYDFELNEPVVTPVMPTSKDQCKKDGWKTYEVFKNQGDCVSHVATGGSNKPANNPQF